MKLEINREFEYLIPALSKPEHDALIASLRTEGCRQPITVWRGKNIIVDGHNRYAICTRLNIPFEVEELDFEDENCVKIWMINNQFARRNLSIELRAELACTLAVVEHELAEKRKLANLKQNANKLETAEISQSTDSLTGGSREIKGKAFEKAAQKAGISRSTVERYDAIQRKGTDEQKEAVRTGQKKIGTVYKEIQAKEKPTEKSQDNNWNIYELFRSKFADKYLEGKYILIHDIKVNDNPQLAYFSNCNDHEQIKRHADSIMGMISVICDKEDISNLRKALQKVISKFVLQKIEHEVEGND